MKYLSISYKILFCILIFFCAATEALAAVPKVLFSDITDAPVTGWEKSSTKGAAVSIYCRDIGSIRGASYVTVGGVNLTNDSDYAEWGATTNPTVPVGMQRITFFLNSTMATGGTYPNSTITVTTSEGTSSAIPFHTRLLGSNHIYFIDNVNGNTANDGLTVATAKRYPAWFRQYAIAGDICYLKGSGTKYTDHDDDRDYYAFAYGGLFTFASKQGVPNHAQGTEGNSISVVGYPGDNVEMEALELNVCHRVITWIYGRLNYWTFAKLSMNAQMPIENKDSVVPPYLGGFSHLRFINLDITTPWHDNTDPDYLGLGLGFSVYLGDTSDHFSVLGCYIHDVGQDERGDLPTDPDGTRVYNMYINGYGQLDYLDIGWNDIGYNTTSRGIQIYAHKDTDTIDHAYVHDNYIHDVARQGIIFGGEAGVENYSFVTRAYIYNNIFTRNGVGDSDMQLGGGFGNGKYGGIYYVYNNVFDNSNNNNYPALHIGYELEHLYLQNNIIICTPNSFNYYTYYPSSVPIPSQNVTASGNLYYGAGDNKKPAWDTSTLDNVDPKFVVSKPQTFLDFQLQGTSPAIGTGVSESVFTVAHDFMNKLRSSPPSIGALEFSEAIQLPTLTIKNITLK